MLINLLNHTDLIKEAPVEFLLYIVVTIVAILISLILHECAHGWMALRCGDPTAKMMGRLSLNPLHHLDPVGTFCMLVFGFGWAKPVPVNSRNFQNYRRDDFLVSIAGIATNLTLFIGCSLLAVLLNLVIWNWDYIPLLNAYYGGASSAEELVNIFSSNGEALANYVAYGISYDWLSVFTTHTWLLYVQRFLLIMVQVNLSLAIFNLLPVPPLDGFHILNDTILRGKLRLNRRVFQTTQLVLFAVIWFTDILDVFLGTASELIGGAVIRTFLMLTGQM